MGLAILLSTLFFILIIILVKEGWKAKITLIAVVLNAIISSWSAIHAISGIPYTEIFNSGNAFGGIPFRVDALSGWFILIINLTCINGAMYGIGYMKTYSNQKGNMALHWSMFVLFQASMLWVCMVQAGFAFLVAWEIMSVSSFLLVMFDHESYNTLKAGINYLVQMHIGVLFLSAAFIWVYISENSYSFNAIAVFFHNNDPRLLFSLFFIGFGIKAGFVPLHTWLPQAHPVAPSHVSGVMSGVIVKVGIYGILRIVSYIYTDFLRIGEAVLILSVITSVYGILNASVHRDFKKMLAFCTIENIGIIGTGIGIGMIGKGIGNNYIMFIGFAGALLHVLNHSLFKSLLFFAAGNIVQQTHTHNIEKLGGLIKKMPKTAFFFLAGAVAIAGLPPLNGFVSEFLIYSGLFEGIKSNNVLFSILMILAISGLAVAGGISILSFTKSFGIIFLGQPRTILEHEPKEVSLIMRVPLVIISLLMLMIGVFPVPLLVYMVSPVVKIFDQNAAVFDSFSPVADTLSLAGISSIIMIAIVFIIYYVRNRMIHQTVSRIVPTWGCGYAVPNAKMQYTGKSFSKTLAKLFYFITSEKKKFKEIESNSIFPVPKKHSSHYPEFFEINIINRLRNGILGFMNYFKFIHNGKTQVYILYGLLFIVALIVSTYFNLIN